MNTVFKVGAAGAMTFAAIAAHASIASPTSASPDAILFAEVVNAAGTAAVASYAGDTGVSIASLKSGAPSTTVLGGDANLQALFAADAAGDTLWFSVQGAQYTGSATSGNFKTPGVANFVTTTVNTQGTQNLSNATTGNLVKFAGIGTDISAINSNINGPATSIEGASPGTAGQFDVTAGGGNVAYWDGGNVGAANPIGTAQNLYYVTAGSPAGTLTHVAYTAVGTASLSASGLTLAANGGGGTGSPPPVPLPAAFWLLGSGLLGLTGVARRRIKA
jgi:hypothetical protein